ncbi:MAG: extracellular solute-binding protein [Candidatus Methanoperedens sp.]|nr:extracellular solute-binding protein [Candidatus Methanoperedens sp.]
MNKMKWQALCSFLALLFIFLFQPFGTFAASSPAGTSTPGPGTASKAAGTWNAIVSKAKEEGKLVISTSHTPVVRQAVAKGFKDAFGIDIEYIGGGKGAELGKKLMAERQAGIYVQDVYIGGTTTILLALKPAGAIDPLEPALMLPEVRDKKLWIDGDYLWCDRDRTTIVILLMPTAGQSSIINSTLVKPGEIRVFDDLLNPKWNGKIVLNDPTVQGPGLRFVGGTASKVKSWDFMKELAKQKPVINREQRLQVEWIARGKYAIGLGMQTDLPTEFINAGAPIVEIIPEDDFNASAGPNDLALVNKAAHPNAAKLFVNWILSKEGQTILTKASGMASVKTNVATDHLTPARRLDPAKKYFIIDHEDYILKESEYMVKAREIFADYLK